MTTIEYTNEEIILKDPQTNLYTCATCSYYTPLKNSFMKHLKTDKHKINENPLECGHCNKLFYTKISLNNHVKTCVIPEINDEENDKESVMEEDNNDEESVMDEKIDDDEENEEDLSLLLTKFGNQYDKLMIKYILLFFLHLKENISFANLLLIIVFFMWTR